MCRLFSMIIVCSGMLAVAGCADSSAKPGATHTAERMVDSMAKGDFASATKDFNSAMNAAMSTQRLGETWSKLIAQTGAFKSRTGSRETQEAGYQTVCVSCQFQKAALDIKVVIDKSGKIGGLWFVAPDAAAGAPPYSAPAYAQKDRFTEREIIVGKGQWQLPGTLSLPKGEGPFPAVVLVHGSGPEDRDETIGPNKPFKDIAWGLASQGIAVVRYDKRTFDPAAKAKLAKIAGTLTPKEEVIDDALAAVALALRRPEIDSKQIYVLGHSLGGTLAPRIVRAGPGIAGLIVMAGCTRPLEDAISEELDYLASLPAAANASEREQLAKLKEEIRKVKLIEPSSKDPSNLLGVPATYWLDIRGYVPAETAKSLKQRMLILQGSRDYQVTEKDFGIWKDVLSSRSGVTFKLYPDLNHLFMTGTGKSTPSEYEKSAHVAPEVISDISSWIKGHKDNAAALTR